MRRFLCLAVFSFALGAASLAAATLLFPKPLHLTREVVDPMTGKTSHLEQYCLANRVVSISGSRTVIADYERSELTEIDRQHGTYSVTPFAAVAAARPHRTARRAAAAKSSPTVEHRGADRRAGRNVELYSADDTSQGLHAEIAVDHGAALSRDALDVLTGAAYPGDGDTPSDLTRQAARRPVAGVSASGATTSESFGLPIEQSFRWQNGAQTITTTNRVTRIGDEIAPADLLTIPPGAGRGVRSPVDSAELLSIRAVVRGRTFVSRLSPEAIGSAGLERHAFVVSQSTIR